MKTVTSKLMLVALIFGASTLIGQTTTNSKVGLSQNGAVSSSEGNISNRQNQRGANFVDSNRDGVCDNYSATGTRRGQNFVDSNKDGVCDHRNGRRFGNGHRNRSMGNNTTKNQEYKRRGARSNYVDTNKNGQCDHAEQTPVEPIGK